MHRWMNVAAGVSAGKLFGGLLDVLLVWSAFSRLAAWCLLGVCLADVCSGGVLLNWQEGREKGEE